MLSSRRDFLLQSAAAGLAASSCRSRADENQPAATPLKIDDDPGELDVFGYMRRRNRPDDSQLFRQILGAANEYKEGDEAIGVSAADDTTRLHARKLLSRTRLADIDSVDLIDDQLTQVLKQSLSEPAGKSPPVATLGELKSLLLNGTEEAIKRLAPSLSSSVIGCVVKLMSNDELIAAGRRIFNPLPGSQIGARGYMGARIQPNSPTDNVDDIQWQVFNGWSYAVGDVVLGTNPVSSDPDSVAAIELTLKDLLTTFEVEDALPQCVLAHIDVQAQVESDVPESTALWFQSIAGTDDANETFDVSIDKMLNYASKRTGPFGLYFETGQGADFTNGHGHGFDMVLHESRKYGFARAMKQRVAKARGVEPEQTWVHLNDVAGFIGPEVFRTRDQLVRCCLEDIVMGKLHGLTIGLDICSTLHMDVSLDDLDWCIDRIMPANPAYLMALPTKIDPMLGYLTTGFQDHVRVRERFGYRVNDRMWKFFQELGVVDASGKPTEHFGDPSWIYLQYRRRKGDARSETELRAEARRQISGVRDRGVFIAEGSGNKPWELAPNLRAEIDQIYDDAKESIWAEWNPEFLTTIPKPEFVRTESIDRTDYILHPTSGERLDAKSLRKLRTVRERHAGQFNVQIIISDGLNALSMMDDGHLTSYLQTFRKAARASGFQVAPENIVVNSGRVRAGYQIGEILMGALVDRRAVVHLIGERPGTGHHTFSAYITAPAGDVWATPGKVDHNITRVVSGIANTALKPVAGATETVRILSQMTARS